MITAILGILIGAVIAWMIVCVILGPEADGSRFEQARVGYQKGAGGAEVTDLFEGDERKTKAAMEQVEHAEPKV